MSHLAFEMLKSSIYPNDGSKLRKEIEISGVKFVVQLFVERCVDLLVKHGSFPL